MVVLGGFFFAEGSLALLTASSRDQQGAKRLLRPPGKGGRRLDTQRRTASGLRMTQPGMLQCSNTVSGRTTGDVARSASLLKHSQRPGRG